MAVILDNAFLSSFFITNVCCISQQGFGQPLLGLVTPATILETSHGWIDYKAAFCDQRRASMSLFLLVCLINDLASAMHIVYDEINK